MGFSLEDIEKADSHCCIFILNDLLCSYGDLLLKTILPCKPYIVNLQFVKQLSVGVKKYIFGRICIQNVHEHPS